MERRTITIRVGTTIRDAEKALLLETLKANGGRRARTAETLGLSEKTVYNKLREYGLLAATRAV